MLRNDKYNPAELASSLSSAEDDERTAIEDEFFNLIFLYIFFSSARNLSSN